jgi:hypothetical protein
MWGYRGRGVTDVGWVVGGCVCSVCMFYVYSYARLYVLCVCVRVCVLLGACFWYDGVRVGVCVVQMSMDAWGGCDVDSNGGVYDDDGVVDICTHSGCVVKSSLIVK